MIQERKVKLIDRRAGLSAKSKALKHVKFWRITSILQDVSCILHWSWSRRLPSKQEYSVSDFDGFGVQVHWIVCIIDSTLRIIILDPYRVVCHSCSYLPIFTDTIQKGVMQRYKSVWNVISGFFLFVWDSSLLKHNLWVQSNTYS